MAQGEGGEPVTCLLLPSDLRRDRAFHSWHLSFPFLTPRLLGAQNALLPHFDDASQQWGKTEMCSSCQTLLAIVSLWLPMPAWRG